MKQLRKALCIALTLCLLASFGFTAANAADETGLHAGAGNGVIKLSSEVMQAAQGGREGFSGEVATYPYARVLLLEDETRVAIVSLELVQISSIVEPLRQLVAEQTNTPLANVWLHVNHTISTPHGSAGEYYDSVAAALTEACEEAVASFAPATMSAGTVELDINRNRNIAALGSNGERIYGLGDTQDSNKIMTVLGFAAEESGEPIGYFLSYGIKPTTLDNSEQKAGTRVMSADLTGLACTMVEEAMGAPCMFAMPAAGDQFPSDNALHYEQGEDGQWTEVDKGVQYGLEIVDRLGAEMGNAAIGLIKSSLIPMKNTKISAAETTFNVTTAGGMGPGGPSEPAPTDLPLNVITIGDVAFVGFKPELDYQTEKEIWEGSPYEHTLLISFLNGDSKYMPHDAAWDYNDGNGSYEMGKSGFARGSAEVLRDTALALLNGMKQGATPGTGGKPAAGLQAGAGIAVMDFSPEVLKAAVYRGSDGFSGETHDPLHARALALDDGKTKAVVVSLEMLIVPSVMSRLKAAVSEIAGTDPANVWINCTHVITSPHNSGGANADLDAEYDQVIINATKAAATDAVANLKPATMSIGTAALDINANRNIKTPEGVEPSNTHFGMDKNGERDTTMTLLRFDGADGKPISVFMSYAIKPTALDNAGKAASARVVSSDVPGYACNMVEAALDGAVCLFGLPAAADQVPEKTASYWDFEQSAEQATDFGVEYGLQIVEELGTKMGDAAIALADGKLTTLENTEIAVAQTSFATTKTDGSATDIAISGLAIGDVALVGYGPELNNATGKQIIAASPYQYTLMLAFTNGHGDYMPHAAAFEYQDGRGTFETSRNGYEKGAAEKFVTAAGEMLNGMKGSESGRTQFSDVATGSYYYDAVLWAVGKKITEGTGGNAFSPDTAVTRAQIVTFLWRNAGRPVPAIDNPFTDVDPVKHEAYYQAILWAYEKGITDGSNSAGTTFSPDETCTLAQILTFLWRYLDQPAAPAGSDFTGVTAGDYYADAVRWAVAEGITKDATAAAFSPSETCTRGQCVTFLYRAFA